MFVAQKRKKEMWTKTKCQSSVKKIYKKKNHKMNNFLLECIENFHIYIYIYNFEKF